MVAIKHAIMVLVTEAVMITIMGQRIMIFDTAQS